MNLHGIEHDDGPRCTSDMCGEADGKFPHPCAREGCDGTVHATLTGIIARMIGKDGACKTACDKCGKPDPDGEKCD